MVPKKAPNPIDKHVGSRVRMRRMMLSMSQEKLGDALGLTFQQVQKYEKGTNRIGASRLQQISLILQVPVAFFFEGVPGPSRFGEAASPEYLTNFLASRPETREGIHARSQHGATAPHHRSHRRDGRRGHRGAPSAKALDDEPTTSAA